MYILTDNDFVESEDSIEVNGVTFHKPLVEKPINADDHNVYIYFPVSAGGGSQRLFRKVPSQFTPCLPIISHSLPHITSNLVVGLSPVWGKLWCWYIYRDFIYSEGQFFFKYYHKHDVRGNLRIKSKRLPVTLPVCLHHQTKLQLAEVCS